MQTDEVESPFKTKSKPTDQEIYYHFRGHSDKLFICKYWLHGDKCRNTVCRFSHGFEEMQPIYFDSRNKILIEPHNPRARFYRTLACPFAKNRMTCPYRELDCCNFAHTIDEIKVYDISNKVINVSASMPPRSSAHSSTHSSASASYMHDTRAHKRPRYETSSDSERRNSYDDELMQYQSVVKKEEM